MPAHTVTLSDGRSFGPADDNTLRQWAREGRVPRDAMIGADDGLAPLRADQHPLLAAVYQAPPTVPGALPAESDATGGLIPYKNKPALVGYYVSIASLIGLVVAPVGVIAGVAAIWLGVSGLRVYKSEPFRRGAAHAWIAIVLGSFVTLLSLAITAMIVLAIASNA